MNNLVSIDNISSNNSFIYCKDITAYIYIYM